MRGDLWWSQCLGTAHVLKDEAGWEDLDELCLCTCRRLTHTLIELSLLAAGTQDSESRGAGLADAFLASVLRREAASSGTSQHCGVSARNRPIMGTAWFFTPASLTTHPQRSGPQAPVLLSWSRCWHWVPRATTTSDAGLTAITLLPTLMVTSK